VAIINADDPYAPLWRSMTRARVLTFGLEPGADVRASELRLEAGAEGFLTRFTLHGQGGTVPVVLALAGRHNVYNALAAAAAAQAAGATLAQVAAGLATMRAVEGRLQFKPAAQGAWLIDDSYNANPSSARAALEVLAELPGRRWLVLGDMAELGAFAEASHRELGTLARACGVERLYSFGRLAALAADSFGAGAERHEDIDTLVRSVGGRCSPMCASWSRVHASTGSSARSPRSQARAARAGRSECCTGLQSTWPRMSRCSTSFPT